MTWFIENFAYVADLTLKHLYLSAIPIVLSLVFAVPIGWAANRKPRLRAVLLSFGGILYAIPSLPLFIVLPAILGTGYLDPNNVIIALTLYATALMIRSCADAFASVSPAVLDAATATGYGSTRRFWTVELPLAGPVILAGLRVASVSTVSLVSIGALIGVANLGSLFTDGFQRDFTTGIFIGIVLIIGIALVFDALLVLASRVLLPWQRVLDGGRAA